MKRAVAAVAIFSAFAGASVFAGEDRSAFDSMGAMMLEHEAEEAQETPAVVRERQMAKCAQQEAELQARIDALDHSIESNFSQFEAFDFSSFQAFEKFDFSNDNDTALELSEQVASLRHQQSEKLRALKLHITDHREVLDELSTAFRDKELLEKVQDALEQAEEVLSND